MVTPIYVDRFRNVGVEEVEATIQIAHPTDLEKEEKTGMFTLVWILEEYRLTCESVQKIAAALNHTIVLCSAGSSATPAALHNPASETPSPIGIRYFHKEKY